MSSQPAPPVVEQYLAALTGARGDAVRAVFQTVHQAMPVGYELGDFRGAPHWFIPLSTYPITYNREPLAYTTLIAQKNYSSLYLMGLYGDEGKDEEFRRRWAATGLTLDMGKSCLRFRTLADLDLGLIAEAIADTSVEQYLATYERAKPA